MLSPRIKILQFFVALLQCGCQRCLLLLAGLILANNVQSAIDEIKVVEQNSASVGAAGVTPTNIVLPGFEPLTARDGVISLGVGRKYSFLDSFLSEQEKILNASQLAEHVGQNVTECEHRVSPDAKAEDNYIVPAKDFVLYELDCTSTVRDFE